MLKQYVRGKNRKKLGLMVAYPDGDGKVKIGFSKCHPRLDSFNKEMAHDLAIGRAERNQDILPNVPNSDLPELWYFVNRCRRYYKDKSFPEWCQEVNRI